MTKDTWRILAMHRVSGLSWVHLAKRWTIIWSERLDSRWTPKLDPYWKSQPATYKVNMEWKLELSLWTKTILTHGSEFLMAWRYLIRTWTTPQKCSSKTALKLNASDFASRSKAKAKPQGRTSASSSTKTILIGERTWADIEPQEHSLSDHSVSKKLINLLRHGSLPREDDGAIEFWRIKDYLQDHFVLSPHWSDEKWKSMFGRRRRTQEKISVLYWFIRSNSVPPSSSRSFRTQSSWSLITWQCRDSGRFLQVHLSRRMCNQSTFHHHFRIDTGRTNFEQETDSILSACGSCG